MAPPMSKADRFRSQFGVDTTAVSSKNIYEDMTEDASERTPSLDEHFGHVAPPGMRFCPVLAVAKFPYKYISKRQMEAVSEKFFTKGRFWQRTWDLYWIWSPHYDPGKAYLFIPLEQFQQFVQEINDAFPDQSIKIPSNAEEVGLVVSFEDHSSLRPKWLGKAESKEDHDFLQTCADPFTSSPDIEKPSERAIASFKETMDVAIDATKQKSKADREKKREERAVKQRDMGRAFKRAQSYLGLCSKTNIDDDSMPEKPCAIDLEQQVPFKFDCDVIFIAVDVESYERNHNLVTEIGIATLDTRDLHKVAPGSCGKNWHEYIHSRHFRIKEYMHLINKDFVLGCPDQFEFGKSEIISQTKASSKVADCFKPPYSDAGAGLDAYGIEAERRNIVFLGHDTMQDVKYLQKIGYDVTNLSNLLEFQDTGVMYRAYTQEPNPRSLGHILWLCEIEPWNLHNAGNDAAYTMQAMLGLCVKDVVKTTDKKADELVKKDQGEAEGGFIDDSKDGRVSLEQMAGLSLTTS